MSTPPDPDPFVTGPNPSPSKPDAAPPPAAPQQPQLHEGQHGYPPYPYPYAPPPRTNGLAIASMVLGIVWIYWIGSILALIFGYAARRQIRERGEGGEGMAMAGIVLGWVGVGVLAIVLFGGAMAAVSSP